MAALARQMFSDKFRLAFDKFPFEPLGLERLILPLPLLIPGKRMPLNLSGILLLITTLPRSTLLVQGRARNRRSGSLSGSAGGGVSRTPRLMWVTRHDQNQDLG